MTKKFLLVLFGIILALLFIELLFRFSSFLFDIHNSYLIRKNFENKDKIIVTCIGESMTADQYPKYLDEFFKESKINNVRVVDEGVGAVNSSFLVNKLENNILKRYKPDIIVAMMGLMDEDNDFKKIKKIPSKLFSFFAFYKLFNIDVFDKGDKEQRLEENKDFYPVDQKIDEKYKIAMNYYNNKKYDDCLEILFSLDYPSHIQKNVKHSIIDALKLSGRKKEVQDYVLKNLEEDIMFNLSQSIKIAYETESAEILQKLFPIDNKNLFKKILLNCLDSVAIIKNAMKQVGLSDELTELDSIIEEIDNNNIVFYNKKLNPFSKTAIDNYKKLADLCDKNNIQLIIMQYPTLSVLPYKKYLKDYKNIIFVSNEENFKKALKNKKYFEIFQDSFAGEFGHCTEYGNKLIAKNLVNIIKKII